MSKKYRTMIPLIIAIAVAPFTSYAFDLSDWVDTDSWKEWAVSWVKKADKEEKKIVEKRPDADPMDDQNQDQSEEKARAEIEDFYANLGVELFSEKLLKGGESRLKNALITRLKAQQFDSAMRFFVSLEKKDHDIAISILDSIENEYRLILLQNCPAPFIAKILVDMRNKDFKGKDYFSHWGPFTLESKNIGKKLVKTANIKGDSVSLRYINFLLTYNVGKEHQGSPEGVKVEINNRGQILANVLSCLSGPDLVSLLVYSREEVLVKMGEEHKACYGDIKKKGVCDEETPIYLDQEFVGQFLSGMHRSNLISTQDISAILEAEFKQNPERYQIILQYIPGEVVRDIAIDFSEEMWNLLPESIQLDATLALEEKERELSKAAMDANKAAVNRTNSTIGASNTIISGTEEATDDSDEKGEEREDL